MTIDVLQGLFFLCISAVSFWIWRKSKNQDYLYFAGFAILGVIANVWDFLTKYVIQLSVEATLLNSRILLAFWVIFTVWVVVIAVRKSR